MTCSACYRTIADDEPMLIVKAARNGQTAERFTGIVWHPGCWPIDRHREYLLEETSMLTAVDATETPS